MASSFLEPWKSLDTLIYLLSLENPVIEVASLQRINTDAFNNPVCQVVVNDGSTLCWDFEVTLSIGNGEYDSLVGCFVRVLIILQDVKPLH